MTRQSSVRRHSTSWSQILTEKQRNQYVPREKTRFIHVEDIPQPITMLLNEFLYPFPLPFHSACICWCSFPMPLHLLQTIPILKSRQPTIAKFQSVFVWDSNQVRKCIPQGFPQSAKCRLPLPSKPINTSSRRPRDVLSVEFVLQSGRFGELHLPIVCVFWPPLLPILRLTVA